MRLLRLCLQDFRSYRQADIDFGGVQLASVVGANGAGKSSLLEAAVFALTGARGLRSLDAFVRQGCDECRVALTFATRGETYRLTRTRSSRGSGKSTLELARLVDDVWVAEGEGARETEARIRQILGVDEETLLGTAIVSQGDAGSFFALRPAQRLEALGSILRLDEQFGPLEAHFRDRAAQARVELDQARRDLERLEADAQRLEERERELAEAEQAVTVAAGDVLCAEDAVERARAEASLAAAAGAALERARAQLREVTERRREMEDRLRTLSQERESLEARTAERSALEQALGERSSLEAALAEAVRAREADQAAAAERRRLEQAATAARRALHEAKAEFRRAEQHVHTVEGELVAATKERDAANAQATDLEERRAKIRAVEQPTCDRCGQPIAGEALEQALVGLNAEWELACARHVTLERQAQAKAVARDAARTDLEAARTRVRERQQECDATEAALAALPPVEYDEGAHRRLEERLRELDAIPARLGQIEALEERLATVRGEAESVAAALEAPDLRQALADAAEAVSEAQGEAEKAEAAGGRVRQAEDALRTAREGLQEAGRWAARLEGEIAQLAPSRESLAETRRAAKRLEQDQADAELLRKAFSKWGVPALIIQNVLLALEREVNELLALYEGSLAVRFESERETRDGVRESLEILVHDGEHWRPFETYSGGERYRVASAMRLGLSQLLAHRSGARVETLIIDEPEGLDADGRAHLARILERMRADFGLILLLTHYEDLKDTMPQQIVVCRGADGLSHVEVAA